MDNDETTQNGPGQREHDARAAEEQKPRGNPETDDQSVRKGQEQLDKVSGN